VEEEHFRRSNGITAHVLFVRDSMDEAPLPPPPRRSSSFKGSDDVCIGLVAVRVVKEWREAGAPARTRSDDDEKEGKGEGGLFS
jgi:hypothetical protein